MREVGARSRSQPAPSWALFEALSQPDRGPSRPWLRLLDDEVEPRVIEAVEPQLIVWSSLWARRPDARVRFDLSPHGPGCTLRWVLRDATVDREWSGPYGDDPADPTKTEVTVTFDPSDADSSFEPGETTTWSFLLTKKDGRWVVSGSGAG